MFGVNCKENMWPRVDNIIFQGIKLLLKEDGVISICNWNYKIVVSVHNEDISYISTCIIRLKIVVERFIFI